MATLTAKNLSLEILEIVDSVRVDELSEDEALIQIDALLDDKSKKLKIYHDGEFTGTFKRVMGQARLRKYMELMGMAEDLSDTSVK